MAQVMVSRVVPQNPLLWFQYYLLSHEVWMHKDAHFFLENSYFYILIISYALSLRTVIED